jgi:hypothetical protein
MASRLYQAMVAFADPKVPQKLRPLWNHAAGPKTIFFWAPGMLHNDNIISDQLEAHSTPASSRFSIQMGNFINILQSQGQ